MRTFLLRLAVMAGILAQAWGQSSTVRYDNATKAVTAPIPFRVGQSAVDPTAPGNGSLWYDTATNTLEARINGATVELGAATIITGANTQVAFFDGADNPAGDPGMTYVKATDTLSVIGGVTTGSLIGEIVEATFLDAADFTLGGHAVTTAGALTFGGATSITGGGTIALGGFTLTVPATGTAVTTATLAGATLPVAATTLSASGAISGHANNTPAATAINFGTAGRGFYEGGATTIKVAFAGALTHTFWNDGSFYMGGTVPELQLPAGGFLSWNAGALTLRHEAAATLQLGVDATTGVNQKLKAMDASAGTGGNLTLAAGTGTTAGGALILQTAATGTLTDRLTITAAGAATFSGNLLIGSAATIFASSGSYQMGATGQYYWATRSAILSPGDGLILLQNNGNSDFNRLQFGLTTSAAPALHRVGTDLQVVHAASTAASNVAAVNAEMTFIEDRYRRKGTGAPEGAVTADISCMYHRTDGGDDTAVYVKISGNGTNTGWKALENVP